MKKAIALITFCLMALAVNAQIEHLKFMGIPLDGDYMEFRKKLEAKGMKYNYISNHISPGKLVYDGEFAGERAKIVVFYDNKEKFVYRAKAVIDYYKESLVISKLTNFQIKLENKYTGRHFDAVQDGFPSWSMIVDGEEGYPVGEISLFITYDKEDKIYSLHVDYKDALNTMNHENNTDDDL